MSKEDELSLLALRIEYKLTEMGGSGFSNMASGITSLAHKHAQPGKALDLLEDLNAMLNIEEKKKYQNSN